IQRPLIEGQDLEGLLLFQLVSTSVEAPRLLPIFGMHVVEPIDLGLRGQVKVIDQLVRRLADRIRLVGVVEAVAGREGRRGKEQRDQAAPEDGDSSPQHETTVGPVEIMRIRNNPRIAGWQRGWGRFELAAQENSSSERI